MKFEVSFPGGMKVDAAYRGHTLHTDQPVEVGGTDTALAPFDLFLGSMVTCAGLYAMRFCQQRDIPTAGLGVTLEPIREAGAKKLGKIRIEVTLPAGFPEKYHEAILRAVDQCAVKRAVLDPPEFEIAMTQAGVAVG
jgi:ribosomal protein S12 methylthiotransferase accessory factor